MVGVGWEPGFDIAIVGEGQARPPGTIHRELPLGVAHIMPCLARCM